MDDQDKGKVVYALIVILLFISAWVLGICAIWITKYSEQLFITGLVVLILSVILSHGIEK